MVLYRDSVSQTCSARRRGQRYMLGPWYRCAADRPRKLRHLTPSVREGLALASGRMVVDSPSCFSRKKSMVCRSRCRGGDVASRGVVVPRRGSHGARA